MVGLYLPFSIFYSFKTDNIPPFPQTNLTVTYTDFRKIKTLTEDNKYYELTYGVDDQRRTSIYKEGEVTKMTRYYVGSYEEEVVGTNVRKIHYLSGAILIQNNGVDSLLYTYSDAQGSLIALTDQNGSLLTKTVNGVTTEIGRFAYDPWGKRRDPLNWNKADSRTGWIINRGYTGHEHLDAFGVINMNGRVYDPLTAMFFSPDPTLTDAGNWLDYNRYSYCMNNPFRYTDPSGYTWWAECWQPVVTTMSAIVVGGVVGILTAGAGTPVVLSGMLAGAAGGFAGGAVGTAAYGGSFGQSMVAGLQGALVGGIMGGITAGIGDAFGPVGSIWNELGRAGAHAFTQGVFSAARGGDFWQGAAAGLLSSFGGSISGALNINSFLGTVGISTAMGAIGSVIAGAKSPEEILFGAVQGAMVGALNFSEHEVEKQRQRDEVEKVATILGLNGTATKVLIQLVDNAKYGKSLEVIGKFAKILGELSGYPAAILSVAKAIDNPTSANIVAAITNSALVLAGPELSILSGILDLTGVSDVVYNFVGGKIDNVIEHAFDIYYNFNQNLNKVLSPENLLNP